MQRVGPYELLKASKQFSLKVKVKINEINTKNKKIKKKAKLVK